MNGEEFLIETNLDADGNLLPAGAIATVDGQKLKANVDRVIGLIQQLAQDPQAELMLDQVEVSIKITASGEVVILGTGASQEASGTQNITLKFRQRDRQIVPAIPTQVPVTVPPIPTIEDRYGKLEKLLLSAQWQAANRETWDLMCDALGKNLGTYLTAQDMQQIPCADLARIDQLWQQYSQGHFGLSAQKKVYQTAMS
jgi:hypothetical protein